MDVCPEHGPGCGWLGFARAHQPMRSHLFPVSDGRWDAYATGFLRGCWSIWCPVHDDNCPGTVKCRDAVLAGLPDG